MDVEFSFGGWLCRRRKALGLSRVELARRSACATVTLRKIEDDARRPSLDLAAILADRLAIPAAQRAAFLRAARGQMPIDQLPPADRS